MRKLSLTTIILLFCASIYAQDKLPIEINRHHKIEYRSYENGDRVPDFSFCGYRASEHPIPDVEVRVKVTYREGDATQRIQRAIDYVSSLPLSEDGFRGAVLLERGRFRVDGTLKIGVSGVVLRGVGSGEDGTVVVGTGVGRETLIQITGVDNKHTYDSVTIADKYVPLGATLLPVAAGHGLKSGDRVVLTRPSTKEWITLLGCEQIGEYVDYPLASWAEGDFDINWERTVLRTDAEWIEIDVPITTSLDPKYGGGYIHKQEWAGRINSVGVENLRCVSEFDRSNEKDENHRWMAITVENCEDGWVRRVTTQNFVSSAVALWESVRCFTVEDCKSLSPVGEIGAYRRYAFQTIGQQTLFQRCYSEYGYHDFSVGFTTVGPNAFVQCYAYRPHNFSGAVGGWSSGTLFDKMTIDGGALSVAFRDVDGQGGGWSGANSLFWQCKAPKQYLPAPPNAYNWAYGGFGQGYGNGLHAMHRKPLKPESFFYAQLDARTGRVSIENDKILRWEPNTFGKTTPPYTAQMSERSKRPELAMDKWIDSMVNMFPIALPKNKIKSIDDIKFAPEMRAKSKAEPAQFTIKNGIAMLGNKAAIGKITRTSLWRGITRPSGIRTATPNLTRFVPGRVGRGLTDDLEVLVSDMFAQGSFAMNHFPSLWYERRRDDHGRLRRADADVWTPFYEQPFSRSGIGEAFDCLSKYDLTKWNSWYWSRLKQYADLADSNGLLLIQDHYLQHNIIEEGAHWADYPWRSANNINELGFAENTYYAGDRRVFMADEFYDTEHPERREFHRNYIRKSLNEFSDNTNIIHHLGAEYTGPLHFVKFWLDVISEWENETGNNAKVMLSATKDVQDAILTDSHYGSAIDVIYIKQWQYRSDGSLYAPEGGVSLTDRQYIRYLDYGEGSFEGVYRAVSEYRNRYPDKAVVFNYAYGRFPMMHWSSFLAGGSFAALPKIADELFYNNAAEMTSLEFSSPSPSQWGVGAASKGYIVYSEASRITLDLRDDKANYILNWIDPITGEVVRTSKLIEAGAVVDINTPSGNPMIMWCSAVVATH